MRVRRLLSASVLAALIAVPLIGTTAAQASTAKAAVPRSREVVLISTSSHFRLTGHRLSFTSKDYNQFGQEVATDLIICRIRGSLQSNPYVDCVATLVSVTNRNVSLFVQFAGHLNGILFGNIVDGTGRFAGARGRFVAAPGPRGTEILTLLFKRF